MRLRARANGAILRAMASTLRIELLLSGLALALAGLLLRLAR
ncbi:MAG: hypothetical protein M0015_16850 [Betaproteobacteria bacterium]|nr:hypothetical protein [Betaproteobacteria bacterium]